MTRDSILCTALYQPQLSRLDTTAREEEIGATQEVTHGLAADHLAGHSLAQCHHIDALIAWIALYSCEMHRLDGV